MNYAIVENGIVTNIIVADEQTAAVIGALPAYDGCAIGNPYATPMTTEEAMMDAIADLTYRMDLQTLGLTEVAQ